MLVGYLYEGMSDFVDNNRVEWVNSSRIGIFERAHPILKVPLFALFIITCIIITILAPLYIVIMSTIFVLHCFEMYAADRIWESFFTYFKVPRHELTEVTDWCTANSRRFYIRMHIGQWSVGFWHKSDAAHFKMVFGEFDT